MALATLKVDLAAGFDGVTQDLRPRKKRSRRCVEAQHGIVDERRMYYRELGLLSPTRQAPRFGELEQVAFPEGREALWWLLNGAVGVVGFRAGADCHVVDPLLCDPLVARLPGTPLLTERSAGRPAARVP